MPQWYKGIFSPSDYFKSLFVFEVCTWDLCHMLTLSWVEAGCKELCIFLVFVGGTSEYLATSLWMIWDVTCVIRTAVTQWYWSFVMDAYVFWLPPFGLGLLLLEKTLFIEAKSLLLLFFSFFHRGCFALLSQEGATSFSVLYLFALMLPMLTFITTMVVVTPDTVDLEDERVCLAGCVWISNSSQPTDMW